ncbi:hypothetical protein CLG96_17695 [Sphingomonas oleivorans]|uniref:TonB C-terminal domain-containing protein n=1 Tax=Sphingomonas oleivorans TaxID=1735121 RepID=A0A2T5FTI0_9SPHN|nr:energy transducer TonB [Sphingomonas oleivorans]PTQ07380.1 hypothetical protein CLG96_17695 [Sphingomonas oleivorans]
MIKFDATDFQRIAVSSVGALLLSATCVVAAVAPARAATPKAPADITEWQAQVERQIDQTLRTPVDENVAGRYAAATVDVSLAADGSVTGSRIAKSSGSRGLDREALRTARAVNYPALPGSLAGKPRTVAMKIFFGRSQQAVAPALKTASDAAVAHNQRIATDAERTRLAQR